MRPNFRRVEIGIEDALDVVVPIVHISKFLVPSDIALVLIPSDLRCRWSRTVKCADVVMELKLKLKVTVAPESRNFPSQSINFRPKIGVPRPSFPGGSEGGYLLHKPCSYTLTPAATPPAPAHGRV